MKIAARKTSPKKANSKKTSKVSAPKDGGQSLEAIFERLKSLLAKYAPPFRTDIACMAGNKKAFQLTVPKPVAIPGAYGGKPVDLQFAALILQKDFVGFYLMCIYMNDGAKKKLSPSLLKLLKGKTCFHVKALDTGLEKDIEAALEMGVKVYQEKGWL